MRRARFAVALGASFLVGAASAEEDLAPKLPAGWSVTQEGEVPAEQAQAIASRLGVTLERLWNQPISINGAKAQVNVLRATDEAAARAIETRLVAMRGADFVARRGRDVAEVPGTNVLVARAVLETYGFRRAGPARFEVSMRLGCVEKADDNRCNDVFLLFLALERDPGRGDLGVAIEDATRTWSFGKTLRLVAPREGWFSSELTFAPAPTQRERAGALDVLTFADPPRLHGVPYVDVTGTYTVNARWRPTEEPEADGALEATDPWPVESKDVRERAEAVVKDATSARERVLALLRHVALDVAYDGPVGSRHGVPRVMAQKFGRCWDKSDLLVTLSRAVRIPARQIAGWVPPLDAGHVWTEVHLDGEGWIPVDATATWLGISEDYIPIFETADGHMPIVHMKKPTIRRLDAPAR